MGMMIYSTKIRIFAIDSEDTYTRFEKYPSKLDISRSFIRIFVRRYVLKQKNENNNNNYGKQNFCICYVFRFDESGTGYQNFGAQWCRLVAY